MPVYPNQSHTHPSQGMTHRDMAATARVAVARDEIIIFRDTGCWSRPYIANGHPTKPFHVKGKSSDWGPQAGLVPLDSEYSKAFAVKDIAKGVAANKHAIKDNFARPIPLFLTETFIRNELLVNKGVTQRPPVNRVTTPRPDVMYFYCEKPNDDAGLPGKAYVLLGKKGSNGLYQIFTFPLDAPQINERALFLKEAEAKPLLVMTVPGADIPITGDYDLFAVCPSWASYGGADRKMDPTLDDTRINASNLRTQERAKAGDKVAIASLARLNAAKTPEDPDRGNLTPRLTAVIRDLTLAMGGRFPRVHHNAESGRPGAPGAEEGFPLTTFHPRSGIAGYPFLNATINQVGDLREYFTRLYAGGYYPPRNRAWNMPTLHPSMHA